MRADIGHRPRGSPNFRFQAPVVIGVVKEPVLGIAPLHRQHIAHLSGGNETPHLGNVRIEAQVVARSVNHAGVLGQFDQAGRLVGGHGQGLLADHVLPRCQSVPGNRVVRLVGRADMHCVDRGIRQQDPIVPFRAANAQRTTEARREIGCLIRDRDHLGVRLPPNVLDMHAPNETGADHGNL